MPRSIYSRPDLEIINEALFRDDFYLFSGLLNDRKWSKENVFQIVMHTIGMEDERFFKKAFDTFGNRLSDDDFFEMFEIHNGFCNIGFFEKLLSLISDEKKTFYAQMMFRHLLRNYPWNVRIARKPDKLLIHMIRNHHEIDVNKADLYSMRYGTIFEFIPQNLSSSVMLALLEREDLVITQDMLNDVFRELSRWKKHEQLELLIENLRFPEESGLRMPNFYPSWRVPKRIKDLRLAKKRKLCA